MVLYFLQLRDIIIFSLDPDKIRTNTDDPEAAYFGI